MSTNHQGYSNKITNSLPPERRTALVNEFLSRWGTVSIGSTCENVNDLENSWNLSVTTPSPMDCTYAVSDAPMSPALQTPRSVPFVFHPDKTKSPSSDEVMFCVLLKTNGPEVAIFISRKFKMDCERPIKELLELLSVDAGCIIPP